MALKTKVVDTSATTPAAFLASAGDPVEIPRVTPQPSPETPTLPPPETTAAPDPAVGTTGAPAETPAAPVPESAPDPFVLLKHWEGKTMKRTLRGLNVTGGMVLRLSAATVNGQLVESLCFVPKATVETIFPQP